MAVKEATESDSMKVLSIVWFNVLPPKYGGQKGTALFNEYLGQHLDLTCLCSRNNLPSGNESYKIINQLPVSKTQFLSPICWWNILKLVKREQADVLILEYPYHGLAAILARWLFKTKFILHQHNIEHLRFKSLRKKWWWLLKLNERWTCRNADLIFFKSEADRAKAIDLFALKAEVCLVVPYGIDNDETSLDPNSIFRKHHIKSSDKLILFAGTLDYAPNAEAVRNIYRHIAPHLDQTGLNYKIVICGRNRLAGYETLNNLTHPNVIPIGEVENIAPYFQAASVFIAPLLSGGGVQTKVIDALSYHCTTVAFAYAVRGIERNVTGDKLLIAADHDWQDFAQAITTASGVTSKTPAAFFKNYHWPEIIGRIVPAIKALTK